MRNGLFRDYLVLEYKDTLLLEGRAKREKMSEADEAAAEVQVRVRVLPGRRVPVPAAAGAAHHFQVFFSPLVRVAN